MEKIIDIINSFGKKKILLIGDTILDIYSYGREVCQSSDSDATEIEEDKISVSFGGASLVASNILELGGQVFFFSVIGNDEAAKNYDNFSHPKLEKHFLIDKNSPTTVKKRFWAGNKKLFQANSVDNRFIEPAIEKRLIQEIEPFIKNIDIIVVLDAQHGLMTENIIASLINSAKKYQKPLYVDSQISHRDSNHHLYKMADCIFFNQTEARAVLPDFDSKKLEDSLRLLREKLVLNNVVVKLGADGSAALFNGEFIKGPPYSVKVMDPCGAGDTFLAAFSLGDREAPAESLMMANTWAALSTTIPGTLPPKKQHLIKIYGQNLKN